MTPTKLQPKPIRLLNNHRKLFSRKRQAFLRALSHRSLHLIRKPS